MNQMTPERSFLWTPEKTWNLKGLFRLPGKCFFILALLWTILHFPFFTGQKSLAPTWTPIETKPIDYYEFPRVRAAFPQLKVNLEKIEWFSKKQLVQILSEALPSNLRQNFLAHAPYALEMAQKYRVDPFWALSIMWTESHFSQQSTSTVGAIGLMQIMPETGSWLAKLINKEGRGDIYMGPHPEDHDLSHGGAKRAKLNTELGVFYLSYLWQKFSFNSVYATVAYNMGPGWVWYRKRYGGAIGVKNEYLDKVTVAYRSLVEVFRSHAQNRSTPQFPNYVVYKKPVSQPKSNPHLKKMRQFVQHYFETRHTETYYVLREPPYGVVPNAYRLSYTH